MTRKLKVLGLALVAVFALSAVAASAAMATEAKFKEEGGTASTYTGSAKATQVFTTDVGEVECTSLNAPGVPSAEESATTETTKVEYSGCEVLGQAASINFNGCNYKFHAGTSTGTGASTGTADVVCPAGKEIEINAVGVCLIKVAAQTGLSSIGFSTVTEGGKEHVRINPNVSNISYSWSGLLCGSGSDTNGTYTGEADVSGNGKNVTIVP